MRDDETNLPVARIRPRGAADRMVLVQDAVARRAGQALGVGIVIGKLAGFMGLMAILATLGGSTRTPRYNDLRIPKLELEKHLDYSLLLNELAKTKYQPPKLDDLNLRDPFEPIGRLEKVYKHEPRVKRQPRP